MEKFYDIFKELPLPAIVLSNEYEEEDSNDEFKYCFKNNRTISSILNSIKSDLDKFNTSPDKHTLLEKTIYINSIRKIYRLRFSKINHSGAQPHFLVLFTDITERRRNIEEIGRLASIVDSSDDAIISMSLNNKIISWNHGAEKIYGYRSDTVIDSSIMKIIPNIISKDFETIVSSVLQGKSYPRYETINCHQDGHIFPASMTLSPLVFHDGIIGVTMISRDISSRRQTEEELKISHRRLKSLMYETVESLSVAHEKRDLYTSGHQRNVSMISCCIADEMNLPHDVIEGLRIAGLLHDIGKVCLPMAILSKPAKLIDEEMALMKKHSIAGYEIVKNIPFTWPVKDIVLQHHERIDGSGYPNGLNGESTLLESKILAVADTLEAMTAHRPYRPALGLKLALEELHNNADVKYDKDVVAAVDRLFEQEVLREEQGKLVCSL
jgi:PAS domain S-box-containing protein